MGPIHEWKFGTRALSLDDSPQLHLHRITQYSQKNADTNLLRAPSELSENRTKASVTTVLGRALVRRREPRCASYTNTAVPYSRISLN